jgi:hypothetical protein
MRLNDTCIFIKSRNLCSVNADNSEIDDKVFLGKRLESSHVDRYRYSCRLFSRRSHFSGNSTRGFGQEASAGLSRSSVLMRDNDSARLSPINAAGSPICARKCRLLALHPDRRIVNHDSTSDNDRLINDRPKLTSTGKIPRGDCLNLDPGRETATNPQKRERRELLTR